MKTIRELLIEENAEYINNVEDVSDQELAGLLMDTERVHTSSKRDAHRWYTRIPCVGKLGEYFVSYLDVETGENNDWDDCVNPSDILNGAKIVERKTRTIEEVYYS